MDEVITDTLALYDDPSSVRPREDLGGAAFVAHGWYSATRDWARGALLLDQAGLTGSASPLRRSMIEHALALFWLSGAPEAVLASLRKAQQENIRKLGKAMAGRGWSVPAELIEELVSPAVNGSTEDTNIHVTNLSLRLGQPNLLVAWLHETATCHASLSSASRYMATWPTDEPIDLTDVLIPQSGKDQLALLLLLASDGFNQFLTGMPWKHQLIELERRFGEALAKGHVGA